MRNDDVYVTALVVTYNRKDLLLRCLAALTQQTVLPQQIVLVDNASTDGTESALDKAGWFARPNFRYVKLEENTGGAGGFSHGLGLISQSRADGWVWMMDDDALPQLDALERLVEKGLNPNHVYGSATISGDRLAWPMGIVSPKKRRISTTLELPELAEVQFVPFLGFMVHSSLVQKIGLPEAGYFLAADDVEYCLRAKAQGAQVYLVGASRIEHPPAKDYFVRLLWRKIYCLELPPWKRYYDTRNRILIARRHYGWRLYAMTIPGSFIRLLGALMREPKRGEQVWAFMAGMIDGLRGRQGRRHQHWKISI